MYTDQEILAALRAIFDQDQLAAVVGRILRVPEAWASLREPEFIDAVISANPPSDLTASHLASMALGGNLQSQVTYELAKEHADRAVRIWEEATVGVAVQRDLVEAALLGMEFGKRFGAEEKELLTLISGSPSTWRSPMAIAWSSLPKPDRLLVALREGNLGRLSIQVVLANLSPSEAGEMLVQNANGSIAKMLQEITGGGESSLAQALKIPREGAQDALAQLLIKATSAQFNGEHSSAHEALQSAWETASETAAQIADFTADQARIANDHVTALEANRKALEILPTPIRRARTALSLIDLDRPGEALSLVSSDGPTVEELVAGGLAQLQVSESGAMLLDALADSEDSLDEEWVALMAAGLTRADQWLPAVEAAELRVTNYPSSAGARFALAQILLEAGDTEAAAEQAAIGLALDPRSEDGRRLLASINQRLGNHTEAFDLLSELPTIDDSKLAEYAIAAGELERAEQLLQEIPPGPRKLVLEGMILNSGGDRVGARTKFQTALRKAPDESSAYEELAAAQVNSADQYNTLTEAIQANPMDPSPRLTLAKHLRAQGRTSEALDVAAAAWELDDTNIRAGLVYADLLGRLGHLDRSLEILRKAAMRQPLSWEVGLALAKAYEKRGDVIQAALSVKPLPPTAAPEAHFDVARIELKAGRHSENAIQHLAMAESQGWKDPSLDYWQGVALEREERFEEAFIRYRRAQDSTDYGLMEEAILGSARAALGMDQSSKALAILEDAQTRFSRSARISAAMSKVYLGTRLPEKALEAAEKAVELDPEETHAWHALSDSLASTGEFRSAVEAIERLSALDPESTDGWIALAQMALHANDRKVVRRSIAEALWRGRRNPKALRDAAQFLDQAGDHRLAVSVMKAAVRARPDDPQLIGALAQAQETAGDYQGAFRSWQSCLKLAPTEPEPLRRGAVCAQRLGLGSQSVKLLERAVAIEPGSHWLRRDLAMAHINQGQVRQGLKAYAGAVKAAPNDSSLAFEAIEIALRSGDPRQALVLLSKMDPALADTARAQAAQGEAFLLLDEREQAITALSDAIHQGYETARSHSMLAICAKDRGLAQQHLEAARSITVESAHDAIWLARAEIGLFNGKEALEAVHDWESDPIAAQERARIALRIRDMLWLFDLADAVSSLTVKRMIEFIDSIQNDLRERGLEPPEIEAWLRIMDDPLELSEYASMDPFGWMHEAIAIGHLVNDQFEAAKEAAEQAKLVCSESAWGHLLEGMIHEAVGRSEEARAAYRVGSLASPIASYLLGRAYARSGSPERAATHIGAAVIETPDQHRWQHKLGGIYFASGDRDSALAHFQEALAGDPENQEYLLSLARAYDAAGHLNQALEGYTAALAHGSDSVEAYRSAGEVALKAGIWQQASRWFERGITLLPSDVDCLIGSAKAAIELGDESLATDRLGLASQESPNDPRVLLGVGYIDTGRRDYPSALAAFEKALDAGADPGEVRRGESRVFVHQGRYRQAAKAMLDVLDSHSEDHRLWNDLAETYEAGAALPDAERAISEAIRIAPVNPDYRLNLARISRKSGNLDRSIEELRKAEGVDPDDARIPVEAGLVYEERREYSRALESYVKAAELDPGSLQAHYRAGLLLRTLKAYRKAGEMLKRAAELAPANQEVMHQLAAVRALELVHG